MMSKAREIAQVEQVEQLGDTDVARRRGVDGIGRYALSVDHM